MSKGYNRLAKHQGRDASGFRDVDNHRRWKSGAYTRQHRRASKGHSRSRQTGGRQPAAHTLRPRAPQPVDTSPTGHEDKELWANLQRRLESAGRSQAAAITKVGISG